MRLRIDAFIVGSVRRLAERKVSDVREQASERDVIFGRSFRKQKNHQQRATKSQRARAALHGLSHGHAGDACRDSVGGCA